MAERRRYVSAGGGAKTAEVRRLNGSAPLHNPECIVPTPMMYAAASVDLQHSAAVKNDRCTT